MNKERLLVLASHLESDILGCGEFYFSDIKHCALAELPVLWPDDWQFNENRVPFLKISGTYMDIVDGVEEWFGLISEERRSLFYPNNVHENNKTKEQVAMKMRKFADEAI